MRGFLGSVRGHFLTGLVLVLPLVVTLWVLYTGIKLLVGFTAPAVKLGFERMGMAPPRFAAEGLSLLITAVALTILGLMARSYVGRQTWRGFEALMMRIPLANPIYSSTKKLIEALQRQKGFQRVVLVEFPRRQCWSVGFLTGPSRGDLSDRVGKPMYNVFVPTTPNPTSGYLVIVPEEDLVELDMTVEEGITFVISGGVVSPELRAKTAPAAP